MRNTRARSETEGQGEEKASIFWSGGGGTFLAGSNTKSVLTKVGFFLLSFFFPMQKFLALIKLLLYVSFLFFTPYLV